MVLPTLPSYLEMKKVNFNEEYMKKKHTIDHDRNAKWSNNREYFSKTNVNSNQHNLWTSERSYNSSMNAYARQMDNSEEQIEEKRERLKRRKEKLSQLYETEAKNMEKELRQMRINGENNSNTLDMLKMRADNLRSAREEDRKKLAEQKLYEHWRQNNPDIRDIESRQLNNFVVNNWQSQISEKEEEHNKLKQMDQEYVKYLEEQREIEIEKDMELRKLKLNRELELKEILKQQMIELKQKDAETEILKREEFELQQQQVELDRLESERVQNEKKYENVEYGRQLLRQHTAKLRKRAKEIQESLEHDLRILEVIRGKEDNERHLESAKRAKAKADAEYMIRVLNDQLRLEKEREAEFDSLFQDEAAKEWEKRTQEWERERIAREKLMKQVFEERQQQINDKYEVIQQKRIESLERREELLRDMQMTQQLAQKEREKMERAKLERKVDMESQINARREQFQANDVEQVNDYEQEKIEQEQYNQFLNSERQKQVETKFEPKSFARKKVNWN